MDSCLGFQWKTADFWAHVVKYAKQQPSHGFIIWTARRVFSIHTHSFPKVQLFRIWHHTDTLDQPQICFFGWMKIQSLLKDFLAGFHLGRSLLCFRYLTGTGIKAAHVCVCSLIWFSLWFSERCFFVRTIQWMSFLSAWAVRYHIHVYNLKQMTADKRKMKQFIYHYKYCTELCKTIRSCLCSFAVMKHPCSTLMGFWAKKTNMASEMHSARERHAPLEWEGQVTHD